MSADLKSQYPLPTVDAQLQSSQPTVESRIQESTEVSGPSVLPNMPTIPDECSARDHWVGVHLHPFCT